MQENVLVGRAWVWRTSPRQRHLDHGRHQNWHRSSVHASSVYRTAVALPETRRSNSAPPGALLRFSVEVERSIVAWLGRTRLIKPNEAHDLAAVLTALQRMGLTPSISCS